MNDNNDEIKSVFLTDGRKIVLEEDDDLILSLTSNDKTEDTYKMPYPSGGYGGGSLQLSPSEKYLVFSYFSGESEEAFSLFEIENGRLKFLYDSGYLYGEDAHYSFVNDEKILVQTFVLSSGIKKMRKLFLGEGYKMDITQIETLTMSDGSVYTGEVKDGLPNGHGKCTRPNGTVYEGEFKDGKFTGQSQFFLK